MRQAYQSDWMPANIELPEDETIFAVGDSHGYLELLKPVVELGLSIAPDCLLISLGDLIDRGPENMENLNYMLGKIASRKEKGIFLPGNHEAMMYGTMNNDAYLESIWMGNGGKWINNYISNNKSIKEALIENLGIENYNILTKNEALLAQRENISDENIKSLLSVNFGNLYFIHAGVPEEHAHQINEWIYKHDALDIFGGFHPLWVREEFLYANPEKYNGNIIVHGHTPEFSIHNGNTIGVHEVQAHRLGLDGGSYYTGVVTGALLKKGFYKIITSERKVF